MRELTERQSMVLAILESSIAEKGYPPTYREIANEMSIASTNAVYDFLIALERKGYVRRDAKVARGIRLVNRVQAAKSEPHACDGRCAHRSTKASLDAEALRVERNTAADLYGEVLVVAERHGFNGAEDDLPEWLEKMLARSERLTG